VSSKGESTREKRPAGGRLGAAGLQIAGIAATNHLLTALLPYLPGYASSTLAGDLPLFTDPDPVALAQTLLRMAVLPGLIEEVLFRGLLFALLIRFGGHRLAILGSALAFGLVHVDPHHILIAGILGLQLGALRHFHGLGLAVLAHIANNAFLLIVRFAAETGSSPPGWLESGRISLLLAAAIAGIACAALVRRERSSPDEPEPPRSALQTRRGLDESR